MSASKNPDPGLSSKAPGSGRTPWYEDMRVIGILLVVVGVLALPLVWFNKTISGRKKFLITVMAVTIAAVLLVLSAQVMTVLKQRLGAVQTERESIVTQAAQS